MCIKLWRKKKKMADLWNRDIVDLLKWMDDVREEMLASESARLHRGFIPREKRRYKEIFADMSARIEVMDPSDFPEVHPLVVEAAPE